MNGNGRHDGWNHNQNMENRQMNQNHSGSCGCGCQQNQNDYNGANNGSHSSNGYNGTNNGSYSYQENSYASNQNNQDMYIQNDMYGNHTYSNGSYYSTGYADTDDPLANLSDESKKFQRITNINSGDAFVMEASNRPIGYYLDPVGTCSRTTEIENTVTNGGVAATGDTLDTQNFVFYKTDNGQFVIANRGNGRVLELVDTRAITNATDGTLVSRVYNPNVLAQFYKRELVPGQTDQFYLITTLNGIEVGINNCHNNPTAWQKYTAYPRDRFENNVYKFLDKTDIVFPNDLKVYPQQLPNPRPLTNINDPGDEPSVLKGKALLPAIFVNDPYLSLNQRIKESPYYILEYTQSWQRIWTDTLNPINGNAAWPETIGVINNAQENMRNIINMTIAGQNPGVGLGLRFGDKSFLFQKQILSGLSISETMYPDMESSERVSSQSNNSTVPIRFVRYLKKHEFVLKRLDGVKIGGPWIMMENTAITKQYPENSNGIRY